ncbi:uncharacterized protein LOC143509303 [Brachyhypopomus gauderio]|uniref:uncharacterized protein LOC143509303 n=1 Tax=Brachyhypopomus gauderio TaxID=698409 RepID=UPI0040433DF6
MAEDSKSPGGTPSCHDATRQLPGYGWRPGLLYGQNFGLPPLLDSRDLVWLESIVRKLGSSCWPGYSRASALAPPADRPSSTVHREMGGGVSEVYDEYSKWRVSLDVNHFAPSEITVKTQDGFLEVTGKHDERQDAHGYISRHFIRKYKLPVGLDAETIQSYLTGDGILSVEASFPDLQKPADITIPVQVKMEVATLQGKQEDGHPAGGGASGQDLPPGEPEAPEAPCPPVPGETSEGVSTAGQSDGEVRRGLTGDLSADYSTQSSTDAGQEAALSVAEGQKEGDEVEEKRYASQGEVGGKQEGAEEGAEDAGEAIMGPEESLDGPEAPAAPEHTGALQTPDQPEAPPPQEDTGALQTPEQLEVPSTAEQGGELPTPDQSPALPTPDTITSGHEESAEVEQGRELQDPEEEMKHGDAEHKQSATQEEIPPQMDVQEKIPPQVDVQEEMAAKKLEAAK